MHFLQSQVVLQLYHVIFQNWWKICDLCDNVVCWVQNVRLYQWTINTYLLTPLWSSSVENQVISSAFITSNLARDGYVYHLSVFRLLRWVLIQWRYSALLHCVGRWVCSSGSHECAASNLIQSHWQWRQHIAPKWWKKIMILHSVKTRKSTIVSTQAWQGLHSANRLGESLSVL